jgi:hypothetical protein
MGFDIGTYRARADTFIVRLAVTKQQQVEKWQKEDSDGLLGW